MSWKNWFHKETIAVEQTTEHPLPLSPRLLTGIDLSRLSPVVRKFFEERGVFSSCNMSIYASGANKCEDIQHQRQWSFDEFLSNWGDNRG